jgi:hypothetical protein
VSRISSHHFGAKRIAIELADDRARQAVADRHFVDGLVPADPRIESIAQLLGTGAFSAQQRDIGARHLAAIGIVAPEEIEEARASPPRDGPFGQLGQGERLEMRVPRGGMTVVRPAYIYVSRMTYRQLVHKRKA